MIRPLIIARPFLMNGSTNAIVERDFLEALSNERFDTTVLCSDRNIINDYKKIRCIAVHENKLLYNFLSVCGRLGFGDLVYQPDQMWLPWGRNATRKATELLQVDKYDYIHSISMPFVNHMAGLALKEKWGKPWIAQFLEPWVDNPYKKFRTQWGRNYFAKLEAGVASKADVIIHNNNAIADRWIDRYGREIAKKIEIIPLMSKIETPKDIGFVNNSKLIISHIGHFYGLRKAEDFINAVFLFITEYPELKDKIQVNLIGKVNLEEVKNINKKGVSNIFNFIGVLPENESDEYLYKSDVLLVIDPKGGDGLFFPSKLVKYFFANKPILGLTSKGSVTDAELLKSHNRSFDFEDSRGIAEYIYRAVTNYNLVCTQDKNYWFHFTPTSIISKYKSLIESLT